MGYGNYSFKAKIYLSGHAVNQDIDIEKVYRELTDRFSRRLALLMVKQTKKRRKLVIDEDIDITVEEVALDLEGGI